MADFNLQGLLSNPNFQDRLGGIGQALSALDQGRTVDLSGINQGIRDRAAQEQLMGNDALLAQFTPEQRQMLATLPPQAAQQIIAETVLAKPDPSVAFRQQLQESGVLNRFSPEQQALLMTLDPSAAQQVIADTLFAEPTGAGHRILSPDEVAAFGLAPGSYQQAPDGKITSIGGGGQTINVQTGDAQGVIQIDEKTGRALIADPNAESGMRWVDIPGGASAQEANKGNAQAQTMLDTIDSILADPGLNTAVGKGGLVTQFMGPFAPESSRARSKIEQLQGQTFLQAFESLKGGGQITEVEGKKAEQAIARLNTAQSPEDFRAALMELRGVVERAQGGASGAPQGVGQSQNPPSADMSDDDLLNMYLGGQ